MAILLIGAFAAGAAAPARADEMLVLPYSCAVVGGRVTLSPAREGHLRIIGPRDQRLFTACSPVNPDMCRSWMVHRFDVDCGGARVPWPAIVAAAAEQMDRRAWFEDGRLLVRMSRWWGRSQDDPCLGDDAYGDGYGYGYGGRWRGRYRRFERPCEDRYGARPPAVEMPRGYAPKLGIPVQFVALPPGHMAGRDAPTEILPRRDYAPGPSGDWGARTEVPATAPYSVPDDAAAPAPRTAIAPPSPAPPEPTEPKARAPEKSVAAPEHAAPATKTARTEPPARDVKITPIKPVQPPGAASTDSDAPGTAALPKILNRPESPRDRAEQAAPPPAPASPAPAVSAPAAQAPKAAAPAPKVAAADPAPAPAAPDRGAAAEEEQPIAVNLLSAPNPAATGLIAAFAGITIVLLSAFAWARRQEHARGLNAARRDIGGVSLGGGMAPRLPASVRAEARVPAADLAVPSRAAWGDEIPASRAEALRLLGAGPEATAGALKKIVDGLRQTWHPDRAADDDDRGLRELRMKQINAAWEILSGKRQES